jgi:hypothetical protein
VNYKDDLLSLRGACKLKLPHLNGGGADQASEAERQKNKTIPGKNMIELLLIYQHQKWILDE